MRDAGHSRLGVVGTWAGATALLAAASAIGFFTAFVLGAWASLRRTVAGAVH